MCSWPAVRRGNSKELNEREQLYGLKTSAEISAAGHGTAGKSSELESYQGRLWKHLRLFITPEWSYLWNKD